MATALRGRILTIHWLDVLSVLSYFSLYLGIKSLYKTQQITQNLLQLCLTFRIEGREVLRCK